MESRRFFWIWLRIWVHDVFRRLNSFLPGGQSPHFLLGWHFGKLYFLVYDLFYISFGALACREFLNNHLVPIMTVSSILLSNLLEELGFFFAMNFENPLWLIPFISATSAKAMSEEQSSVWSLNFVDLFSYFSRIHLVFVRFLRETRGSFESLV